MEGVSFLMSAGLAKTLVQEVRLSLEEALVNIISHGFEDAAVHHIYITMTISDRVLGVEIADDGKPFNPVLFHPPDMDKPFDQHRIGGFGVRLIRSLMDQMEYTRFRDRNILRMKKYIGNEPFNKEGLCR